MTPEQSAAAVAAAGSDLRFLLDKEKIDMEFQTSLFHNGVLTVRQFAALCADVNDLRALLKSDFVMSPEGGMAMRVKISRVVVAWESAKARAGKAAEQEGESEVRREPKPLYSTDYTAMKLAYEAEWWKLDDSLIPTGCMWRSSWRPWTRWTSWRSPCPRSCARRTRRQTGFAQPGIRRGCSGP